MASNRKGIICVAYGCSNTTSEGVKLHSFPWKKHPEIAKEWERNVSKTRANWKSTKWSRLCSAHFEEHCFTLSSRTRRTFDPTYPLVLEESAVPTLFDRPGPNQSVKRETDDSRPPEGAVKKRKSGGAFAKRERARVRGYVLLFNTCMLFKICCNVTNASYTIAYYLSIGQSS